MPFLKNGQKKIYIQIILLFKAWWLVNKTHEGECSLQNTILFLENLQTTILTSYKDADTFAKNTGSRSHYKITTILLNRKLSYCV